MIEATDLDTFLDWKQLSSMAGSTKPARPSMDVMGATSN